MISTIFTFFEALLGLAKHATTKVAERIEEGKPDFKAKLESATKQIKERCGTD
jgi:hypothetical protein